jgi:tRNA threonylcarbamoyladenosine biosynthesis protein TsaB
MLVLALETSTPQSSVALGTEQGIIASMTFSWGRGHSEIVTPAIDRLLRWTEIDPRQIVGVAVGLGPGLFTGLRVGVSTARAIAQVLGCSVVGIPSLDGLAFGVRHSRWKIGAAIDGKRGQMFYAFYRPVPGGVARETEYQVGPPDRIIADLDATGEDTLLVGNGALLYRRQLQEAATRLEFASVSLAFPVASSLLELSVPRFQREEAQRPEQVVPLYVRKSDAEINWAARARSA